jgi:uncharacterized protein involved in exopolysaccharide biosynthesis
MLHLRSAQVSVQELLVVFRRRRAYFIWSFVLLLGISIGGAFLLPRKYESSTTILAQRDEVLNPLVNYSMAVSMASDDRLRTFNEIVFSLTARQTIVDSLHLDQNLVTDMERQDLLVRVGKDIEAERPGSATFRIGYLDSDPQRAQHGVAVLARYFIKTILSVENQRNELAVQFFEGKLDELKQKFETEQSNVIALMRDRISDMPVENQTLWSNIEDFNKRIGTYDDQIKVLRRGQDLMAQFAPEGSVELNLQILYELQRADLPHAAELQPLVSKYDDASRRFTPKFPEVRKLMGQITDVLAAMKSSVASELELANHNRADLDSQKSQMVENLKQSTAFQEIDKDKKSSFDVISGLYNEMKVKLEQARTNRDLGRRGNEEFIVIDPPLIPTSLTKPNRAMIISGGGVLGLIVGLFAIALAELLDPTIRGPLDIVLYRRKIVAFLPDRVA